MSQEHRPGSGPEPTARRPRWRQRRWAIAAAVLLIIVVLCAVPGVRLHERALGLAQWAQPLAAFTPLLLGLVAAIACSVAYRNYVVAREQLQHRRAADDADLRQRRAADDAVLEQRRAADARAEWWRRVQAAIELVTSADRAFTATGFTLLDVLAKDPEVSVEDIATLREVIVSLQGDVKAAVEQEDQGMPPSWSE